MSRHTSLETLRERYHKSRQWTQDTNSNRSISPPTTLSNSPVTTVYEEEESEEEEEEEEEEEGEEEEREEEEEDDFSICSSTSSIPDENINFDLVYALHTFVATVDGQASVVKGDAMTLLDDSNSYWWLIRALKTSEVGYIPAENIETPFERLARLNKHRNIQVTSPDQLQFFPAEPASSKTRVKRRVKVSKDLACQMQIILTDEDNQSHYEEAFEEWDEQMTAEQYRESDTEEEDTKRYRKKKLAPLINADYVKPPVVVSTILDKPLPILEEKEAPEAEEQLPKPAVTGLRRLFSLGKKDRDTKQNEDTQYHVLRIFAGNINVGALFNTVAVTPDMNADQLLKLALEKFHIPLIDYQTTGQNNIEYYLTVKSMDGDEITLAPLDKPLAIFESLSDHLTTPMPSLTYIKRLSMEQPTIKVTRVGVSKARQRAKSRFGEDSVIRFSLHKRIKRVIDTDGQQQIYVKISYYSENSSVSVENTGMNTNKISTMGLIRKSSLLRVDLQVQQQLLMKKARKEERIDKLVALSTVTQISELTTIAQEKFHLTNDIHPAPFFLTLSVNGNETRLSPEKTIGEVLNDPKLVPKGTLEKLFVLRKNKVLSPVTLPESTQETNTGNRFVRYLLKQDHPSKTAVQPYNIEHEVTSTGNVLKRLDQAILSLENDKRQLDIKNNVNQPKLANVPVRSNSLSAMSRYRGYSKSNRTELSPKEDTRKVPLRSSSLTISNDGFDARTNLSNLDDLEMELQRIASFHAS